MWLLYLRDQFIFVYYIANVVLYYFVNYYGIISLVKDNLFSVGLLGKIKLNDLVL